MLARRVVFRGFFNVVDDDSDASKASSNVFAVLRNFDTRAPRDPTLCHSCADAVAVAPRYLYPSTHSQSGNRSMDFCNRRESCHASLCLRRLAVYGVMDFIEVNFLYVFENPDED